MPKGIKPPTTNNMDLIVEWSFQKALKDFAAVQAMGGSDIYTQAGEEISHGDFSSAVKTLRDAAAAIRNMVEVAARLATFTDLFADSIEDEMPGHDDV